jgi:2-hydroxymuconate-semialdehyde hydrolase
MIPGVRSRFVKVQGVRTHYLEAGEGPELVLLHDGGWGGSGEFSWEFNIGPLAEHFRVIAPDWLGFGQTDKLHDFDSKSDRMIRHMAAFLDIMCIDDDSPAFFAGMSMGGTRLIQEAARGERCRFPLRAIATASGGGFMPDNEWRRAGLAFDGTVESMRKAMQGAHSDPRFWEDEAYVRRRAEAGMRPGAWESVAAARFKAPNVAPRGAFGQEDTTAYEQIRVPTLIVAGSEDKLRLPGWTKELEARVPDIEVLVVEGAGHNVNIEAAKAFNDALIRFFLADRLLEASDDGR